MQASEGTQAKPIDIVSDIIYRDGESNIVYASGNVLVMYGSELIVAERVLYNTETEDLYAEGEVAYTRGDGSVFFGDKVRLNNLYLSGIILNFRGRFGGTSSIAAKSAEVIGKDRIVMESMVYTPCRICKENFFKDKPLWQIRTNRSVYDKKDEKIEHKDAVLEVAGIPVMYSPYVATPGPGAKRRSGFLLPKYSGSSITGQRIHTVYYWNIAQDRDATFGINLNPFDSRHTVYDLEYRQKFKHGHYKIFSTLNYGDKLRADGSKVANQRMWKGHYDFSGYSELGSGIITLESRAVLDPAKTYLKQYKITEDNVLKTDAHFRSIKEDQFYSVRGLFFQDLRPSESPKTTAQVLPVLQYNKNYQLSQSVRGDFLINYTNLTRREGSRYNRLVSEGKLSNRYITSAGFVLDNSASVRCDLYYKTFKAIAQNTQYAEDILDGSKQIGRVNPEFVTTAHIPLSGSSVVLDPILQIIASPLQKNMYKVANADSRHPELSAYNLFSTNRYTGFDRMETGTRFNYGVLADFHNDLFWNANLILGQSYRIHKDPALSKFSGLYRNFSDYVATVNFTPITNLGLRSSSRFDSRNFSLNMQGIGMTYSAKKFLINTEYLYISKKVLADEKNKFINSQEVMFSTSWNIHRDWWINLETRSKLGKRQSSVASNFIKNSIKVQNINECLSTEFSVTRDYTKTKNLRPETVFIFKVSVPIF